MLVEDASRDELVGSFLFLSRYVSMSELSLVVPDTAKFPRRGCYLSFRLAV